MKRPSMYNRHEASLKAFVEKFNNVKDDLRLVMQIYNTENFRDDGVIVDTKTGKRITFDWEIRDRYFKSGKFVFKELGQFERKLKKGEIGLSLQCDQDETAVMAAWHEDWLKEKPRKKKLRTDQKSDEFGMVRYTRHFRIYFYKKIGEFRKMISKALIKSSFNHTVFHDRNS